jgi:hypothetical protein
MMPKYCETEGCTNIVHPPEDLCDECKPVDPLAENFDEDSELRSIWSPVKGGR